MTAKPSRPGAAIDTIITDQCALVARPQDDFRVDLLVSEGDRVAQGAPVLRSRKHPDLVVVAPVAGEVAQIELGPGRRLSQILFFHDPRGDRYVHTGASGNLAGAELRAVLHASGLWGHFRSRPFGRVPLPAEVPSAIFVMALDTRADAPSPALAIEGREDDFMRGLQAVTQLCEGPVAICQDQGRDLPGLADIDHRLRVLRVAPIHPNGLPGMQIVDHHPAEIGRTVWDIHAEDVAAIGELLRTGMVAQTRLVRIAGPALSTTRLVRCQPGADLRGLTFDIARPGPHRLLSGSAIDGIESRWLGPWHRQVTGIPTLARHPFAHWFSAALRRAGRPLPIVPTAALDGAFAGKLPAAALVRAIASNDVETARRLGMLSLIEDDLALADYVTGASPCLSAMLRRMLEGVMAEEGP